MHELSIAGGILKVIETSAQKEQFKRVTHLRLEVGSLSGVEVRALRFALDAIAPGTLIASAEIIMETPAGQGWCMPCARTIVLENRGDACPHCGAYQIQATDGTECRIMDMHVEDA